jgi:hypothetical protein
VKDNGNSPAFPSHQPFNYLGITKRELFAMAVMNIISDPEGDGNVITLARAAVVIADALLDELAK